MTKDKALKLALDTLISYRTVIKKYGYAFEKGDAAIAACNEVLAQPKQEPFKPDWLSYRQGKLDGAAEALEETKRKEWVGLTGGDMDDITSTAMDKADAMLLTEAKMKEKNHD